MKRKWHHPEAEVAGPPARRDYWRSYDELEDTPEFREWLEREFPRGASELAQCEDDSSSRRSFLKLMGASASLAGLGLSSCRRADEFIVPYNEFVEWAIPGKALYYASAMPTTDGCVPLVVTTYEGRPVKVDGNRLHPACSGGSDSFVQASILNLYDPDRSRSHLRWVDGKQEAATAEDFEKEFLAGFRSGKGERTAILVGASSSPTRARILGEVRKKFPQIRVYQHEPLVSAAKQQAEKALWGDGVSATPRFDKADRILALDADFLGLDKQGEDPGAQWAAQRNPDLGEKMARLYMVEPAFTLTGGAADHRLRTPASQVLKVAALFAVQIGKALGNGELQAAGASLAGKFNAGIFNAAWIEKAAADIAKSGARSIVVAGTRQSAAVQVLAGMINQALGSAGENGPVQLSKHGREALPGIVELTQAIAGKQIDTLISLTPSDPFFDAPADLKFTERCKEGLKSLIHCGIRFNRTASFATWHVPGTHYLETWGDAQSVSGVYSVVQPMILPLFNGVSELDFLLKLLEAPAAPAAAPAPAATPAAAPAPAGGAPAPAAPAPVAETAPKAAPAYTAVRDTFRTLAQGDVEKAWNLTLRDGFLNGSKFAAAAPVTAGGAAAILQAAVIAEHPTAEAMEVVLTPSSQVWDGRFINNSWLQEVPDPITKLTWDNAAVMSIKTAEQLGIKRDGQMLTILAGERTVRVPAFRLPGHADFTITLPLGYYGQEEKDQRITGRVGIGTGFDAYPLLTSSTAYIVPGAKVAVSTEKYQLAPTAIHWSMEGRAIVREGTLAHYQDEHYDFAKQGMDSHIPPNIPLYKGPDYKVMESPLDGSMKSKEALDLTGSPLQDGFRHYAIDPLHQWGMTIDLNTCLGCNACAIACQAENNIPVVGKDQVIAGREMHWIRMDRYFSSPTEDGTAAAERKFVPETRGRPIPDDDNVEMLSQPVACVHCEYAPCETVCPVNATVHTGDGLNAMTYNRCIGTRYCANNCPYKARRFNYFDYNKRWIEDFYWGPVAEEAGLGTTSLQLQKNPNVTVRMRGVIEKCTYCVQRVQKAKIDAKAKARDSKDVQVKAGVVTTACQDACPTRAIEFGNLLLAEEKVSKLKGQRGGESPNKRNYDLLKYIGTRPRTSYLAKIRNPNMEMPGAEHIGHATADMH